MIPTRYRQVRAPTAFAIAVGLAAILAGISSSASSSGKTDAPKMRVAQRVVAEDTSSKHVFRVVEVIPKLENPWSFQFLPEGGILFTEREGRLGIWKDGEIQNVTGLPRIFAKGQGGLLDVALHPDFAKNRRIYFTYSSAYDKGYGTCVAGAVLTAEPRLADLTTLLCMKPAGRNTVHFGSRLAFDAEGYLFVTFGERGEAERAQDLGAHNGKVIRIDTAGAPAPGNPFLKRKGALPEIYSYGHRNPQGLFYDRLTKTMWLHEHGPQGGDALRRLRAGANYGWPIATYGEQYGGGKIGKKPHEIEGIEIPVVYWGPPSIAPSGMTLYRGSAFPKWKGNLFVGALAQRHIRRLELKNGKVALQEELLRDAIGRIHDIREGPDGNLWFATDEKDGGIYRIEPADAVAK